MHYLPFFYMLCSNLIMQAVTFETSIVDKDADTKIISIQMNLDENEMIIANSLHASIDNPFVTLNTPEISIRPTNQYVPEFQRKKQVYHTHFNITILVHFQEKNRDIHPCLQLSYLSNHHPGVQHISMMIPCQSLPIDEQYATENKQSFSAASNLKNRSSDYKPSWSSMVQNLVETSQSTWIQILFALLLGLLLSLTPCIYPMIPITLGILHQNKQTSLLYNFFNSFCYALGLATTFACLGIVATFAGTSFGSLLSYPPFVICMIIGIGYMSLTMIGWVNLYIPSFLQGQIKLNNHYGPFVASYLFGAISGSIASPCVSPGLALLLSIVATLGNKIIGFFLLFSFGIGLSIPLIIIGTFSNALYILPKSGMWMVEVKKGVGFFMLATCLYYLSNISPMYIVAWLGTGLTGLIGLYYAYHADKLNPYQKAYTIIGICMIGMTMLFGIQAYELTWYSNTSQENQILPWQSNYQSAVQLAQQEGKILFVDVWAPYCTMCKAIEKKVLNNQIFIKSMQHKFIFIKINAADHDNSDYLFLKEKYKVYAQPTLLCIDPITETVLYKVTSEPYHMKIEQFVEQLNQLTIRSTTL